MPKIDYLSDAEANELVGDEIVILRSALFPSMYSGKRATILEVDKRESFPFLVSVGKRVTRRTTQRTNVTVIGVSEVGVIGG